MPLAAPGPELVPAEVAGGPGWILGVYGDGLGIGGPAYLVALWVAFLSYLAVVACAPALGGRLIAAAIGIAVVAFALSPPLLSQDVFSYISYARLGADHGLNPYAHAPIDFPGDPSFPFVGRGEAPGDLGWQDDVSAYGPLFTLATYPLAALSVPAALWTMKAVAALSVLGLAAIVARLAPARGIDPRTAAAFVALNPLVLVHVVGGAHNDGLMMLLVMAGCAAVLGAREATGGAALLAAGALKFSAAFAGPFALLGAQRRARFLVGAGLAAAAIVLVSLAAFGTHLLDAAGLVGENQAKTSHYAIPSQLARVLPGGAGSWQAAALVLYALLVVWLAVGVWRGEDWMRAAGWAALGLLVATGWLLPWYVVWALPLVALGRDGALTATTLALVAYQLVNRVPL